MPLLAQCIMARQSVILDASETCSRVKVIIRHAMACVQFMPLVKPPDASRLQILLQAPCKDVCMLFSGVCRCAHILVLLGNKMCRTGTQQLSSQHHDLADPESLNSLVRNENSQLLRSHTCAHPPIRWVKRMCASSLLICCKVFT